MIPPTSLRTFRTVLAAAALAAAVAPGPVFADRARDAAMQQQLAVIVSCGDRARDAANAAESGLKSARKALSSLETVRLHVDYSRTAMGDVLESVRSDPPSALAAVRAKRDAAVASWERIEGRDTAYGSFTESRDAFIRAKTAFTNAVAEGGDARYVGSETKPFSGADEAYSVRFDGLGARMFGPSGLVGEMEKISAEAEKLNLAIQTASKEFSNDRAFVADWIRMKETPPPGPGGAVVVKEKPRVSYLLPSGDLWEDREVAPGSSVRNPDKGKPAERFRLFAGWTDDAGNAVDVARFKMPDKPLALHAKFTNAVYAVRFLDAAGGAFETRSYEPARGALPAPSAVPARFGWRFAKWVRRDTGDDAPFGGFPEENLVLEPRWEPAPFPCRFVDGDAVVARENPLYTDAVPAVDVPPRDHWENLGWAAAPDGEPVAAGAKVSDLLADGAEELVLFARRRPVVYDVAFFARTAESADPQPRGAAKGSAVSPVGTDKVPAAEELPGRVFEGWFAPGADGPFDPEEPLLADAELTARYRTVTNTVSFFDLDGAEWAVARVSVDEPLRQPKRPPEKEGWNFLGWTLGGEPFADWDEAPGSDLELRAAGERRSYEIEIRWNDGVRGPEKRTVFHGDAIEDPGEPFREGWTFRGWETVRGRNRRAPAAFPLEAKESFRLEAKMAADRPPVPPGHLRLMLPDGFCK